MGRWTAFVLAIFFAACGGDAPYVEPTPVVHIPDYATTYDLSQPQPDLLGCDKYIGEPGVAACTYYACRDEIAQCGPTGYYLGFGEKYCERFLVDLSPKMSPAGQQFLVAARDCLMQYLEKSVPTTTSCSDVKSEALQSHVRCYTDYGFCSLPLSDRALLFASIDSSDLDFKTALETELTCF
jgi:hypothetical protein